MLEQLDQFLTLPAPWLLLALGLAALLEYVFPPFPGDTITVLGAYAAVTGKAGLISVFVAVTVGSMVGMSLVYQGGSWLKKRNAAAGGLVEGKGLGRFIRPDRMELVAEQYRKRGLWLILANRFLPLTRSIFFVFAGMSGVSYWWTMLLGSISAAAWNVMLLAIGFSIGANLEALESAVSSYSRLAWLIVGGVLLLAVSIGLFRWWLRKRAASAVSSEAAS